jgi:hypothetical protein
MIRYVPIEEDGLFAWYDTVYNGFEVFCGVSSWTTWADFAMDFLNAEGDCPQKLERFRRLMPKDSA